MAKKNIEDVEDRVYKITDPDWTDYVMTLFSEDEVVKDNGKDFPKVDGLRRVVESLFGPIIESKCTDTKFINDDVVGRAISTYLVKVLVTNNDFIETAGDIYKDIPDLKLSTEEVADSWHGNTDDNYCAFAVALSATRAEARCLRKLLRLKRCSADEITREKNPAEVVKQNKPAGDWNENEMANTNQIGLIERRCSQMNVDLMSFINSGTQSYSSIEEVTKKTASKMIEELNKMNNNRETIPEEIKYSS